MIRRNLLATLVLLCSGCASYITPGGPARLDQIDRADIAEVAARKPTTKFPARIAVVRIQSSSYRSYSTDANDDPRGNSYGQAPFRVVLTQELLTDQQIETMGKWPSVAGVAPVTRLILPSRLDTIDDLRLAGAKVQADILLVYTIDTSFRIQGKGYGPLTAISLGLVPDRDAYITSTASAILIDVRSGFVYGVAEATAKTSGLASVWTARSTVDQKRVESEAASFNGLMEQMTRTWSGIVKQYQ